MMKPKIALLFLFFSMALGIQNSFSQGFLQKLKNKAEDNMVNKALGDDKNKTPSSGNNSGASGNSNSNSVQNTKGSGLTNTTPDVMENIKSAKTSLQAKNYTDARNSTRQAMLGVEMEMGQNVLKSLPDNADGMARLPEQDNVTSSSMGFAGIVVQRVYQQNDKELRIIVQNNTLLSGTNAYTNNGYTASNNQNSKQVKVKGYNGVLQFDQNSGYSINVSVGQSSVFTSNGVNYPDEKTFMAAVNQFDFDKIKKELGEK